jgi:hypothetical protein
MSTKLLKSMLQRSTNESAYVVDAGISLSDKKVPSSSMKKSRVRKRQRTIDDDVPVDKKALLDATITWFLTVDQSMAALGTRKDAALERFNNQNLQAKKRRKRSEELVVGNSRSSSSKMRLTPERTFNKERHNKQKEEEKLMEIARLLKTDKTMRKTSAKNVMK